MGNKRQQEESDGDDFPDITKDITQPKPEPEENKPAATTKKGKKGKKGNNQPPRGAVRVQKDEDSDEDLMAKMAAEMKLEEEAAQNSQPSPQVNKKNKKKGK